MRITGLEVAILQESGRPGDNRERVRVILSAPGPAPRVLRLTIIHPTRAGEDQVIRLAPMGEGTYAGAMGVPRGAAMGLRLEDDEAGWRIVGTWFTEESSVSLGASP